jgi:hypothetical protein
METVNPSQSPVFGSSRSPAEIATRKQRVKESLCCPYCDSGLSKWQVPDSPFNEWPSQYQFICFNDECAYFVRGWQTMSAQGNFGSYRFMYDPPTDGCHTVVVLAPNALREGIVGAEPKPAERQVHT